MKRRIWLVLLGATAVVSIANPAFADDDDRHDRRERQEHEEHERREAREHGGRSGWQRDRDHDDDRGRAWGGGPRQEQWRRPWGGGPRQDDWRDRGRYDDGGPYGSRGWYDERRYAPPAPYDSPPVPGPGTGPGIVFQW